MTGQQKGAYSSHRNNTSQERNGMFMAKNKNYLPQSTAGLVRYFDEYHDAVEIKPEVVVGISAAIIVLYIVARIGVV